VRVAKERLDTHRQRRRVGDSRLSPEEREIVRRLVSGDLTDEFQARPRSGERSRSDDAVPNGHLW
jgi:exonuclease III